MPLKAALVMPYLLDKSSAGSKAFRLLWTREIASCLSTKLACPCMLNGQCWALCQMLWTSPEMMCIAAVNGTDDVISVALVCRACSLSQASRK